LHQIRKTAQKGRTHLDLCNRQQKQICDKHKKIHRGHLQNYTHNFTNINPCNMTSSQASSSSNTFPAPPTELLKPIGFSFERIYALYIQHCISKDAWDQLMWCPEKFPLFSEVYQAFAKTQEYQGLEQARQQYLPAHNKRYVNRANEERAQYTRLERVYSQASYHATLRFQAIIKKKMEEKGIPNPEKEMPTRKRAREEPVPEQEDRQVKRIRRLNSELNCTMRHTILAGELHENALQLRSRNIHLRRRAN